MEEWRDIAGYEGRYMVSNKGRVKSLERKFNTGNNGYRILKEKILKPIKYSTGYLGVTLYKYGKSKSCNIHRLVAHAFIPNPENLPQVNHIDENKENNCIDNLEWVTCKENINHGTRSKRSSQAMKGRKHTKEHNKKVSEALKNRDCSYQNKPVMGINKTSGLVLLFSSIKGASEKTGIDQSSITKCCKGKRNSAGGFYWFYAD